MALEVRAFSLALWLYAKGHTPLRAVRRGRDVAFLFPDRAAGSINGYFGARELLSDYERRARRAQNVAVAP